MKINTAVIGTGLMGLMHAKIYASLNDCLEFHGIIFLKSSETSPIKSKCMVGRFFTQ